MYRVQYSLQLHTSLGTLDHVLCRQGGTTVQCLVPCALQNTNSLVFKWGGEWRICLYFKMGNRRPGQVDLSKEHQNWLWWRFPPASSPVPSVRLRCPNPKPHSRHLTNNNTDIHCHVWRPCYLLGAVSFYAHINNYSVRELLYLTYRRNQNKKKAVLKGKPTHSRAHNL